MSICDLASFKLYIGTSSSSGSDSLLQSCLDAAEREVLNFCHRSTAYTGFEASTGLTRYYRSGDIMHLDHNGLSGEVLWLGDADLLSVDTLLNGTTTEITSSGYWLEPRNHAPYRYIRLKSAGSWVFETDGEVAVTGTWGRSTAADAEIIDFVKQTARYKMDLRASQTFDVTAMPDIGQIAIPKGIPANVKMGLKSGGYIRTLVVY